jgi:ParB family chromosome partitioning protein
MVIPDGEIQIVPLADIDLFVNQSREQFDEAELRHLADNIKTNGLLQPVVGCRDAGRGRFVLICGERRFRASRLAGLASIAMKVIPGPLSPGQMLQINLAENIQRCSLNPVERGKAFRRLMQLEDLSASEVAARMNVSNATVSRDLSLLELPEALQAAVASDELPASVAASIARLDDERACVAIADRYRSGGLNRAAVVEEVNQQLHPGGKPDKPSRVVLKSAGVSISVSGQPGKLTIETLLALLNRVVREADSLKKAGKTDVAALAQALKAS